MADGNHAELRDDVQADVGRLPRHRGGTKLRLGSPLHAGREEVCEGLALAFVGMMLIRVYERAHHDRSPALVSSWQETGLVYSWCRNCMRVSSRCSVQRALAGSSVAMRAWFRGRAIIS